MIHQFLPGLFGFVAAFVIGVHMKPVSWLSLIISVAGGVFAGAILTVLMLYA